MSGLTGVVVGLLLGSGATATLALILVARWGAVTPSQSNGMRAGHGTPKKGGRP